MKRRTLLKNMMLMGGGLMAIPSWAIGWSRTTVAATTTFLSASNQALLSEIVGTIIPATDTPGAKELGVDVLIQKILADCYEKEVRADFARGIEGVDFRMKKTYSKSFLEASPQERLQLLKEIEAEEQLKDQQQQSSRAAEPQGTPPAPSFFKLLKELTILGYTNSEYVMTQLTGYVAVPGHYYGCVPYTPKISS